MAKQLNRNAILSLIILVLVAALAAAGLFIVNEGEQAVVTRFGKITQVYVDAGMKFKLPFMDKVTTYSKKVLSWDGAPQSVPTSEQQYIWVDTTARWRIVDPAVFYQRVTTIDAGYARLDNVIESAVRTVVSKYPMAESVRSTNNILSDSEAALSAATEELQTTELADGGETPGVNDLLVAAYSPIDYGREELAKEMLNRAQPSMPEYGIELLDVVIRQIRYSDNLTNTVHARMISERQKVATGYRSEGSGLKAEWLGRLNRDRDIKLSEAERKAAEIRASGDAEAARIYSEAYEQDPEFYSFWKAMESYEKVLPGQRKILSTDMDFFKYLYSAQ